MAAPKRVSYTKRRYLTDANPVIPKQSKKRWLIENELLLGVNGENSASTSRDDSTDIGDLDCDGTLVLLSLTIQLANKPSGGQSSRGLENSQTSQLANSEFLKIMELLYFICTLQRTISVTLSNIGSV